VKTLLLTLGLTALFLGIGAAVAFGVPGVTNGLLSPDDEAAADSLDAAGGPAQPAAERIEPLAEDMAALNERLSAAEARADSLRRLLDDQRATYEASTSEAADLAKTLVALEQADLESVVQQLDGRSFVQLYEASTNRNRGRLLDALTPAQAAAFVRHQLPGGGARAPRAAPRPAASDSSSAPARRTPAP
jgi:hypothetical protein